MLPPIMARLLSHKLHSWAKYTVGEKEKKNALMCKQACAGEDAMVVWHSD